MKLANFRLQAQKLNTPELKMKYLAETSSRQSNRTEVVSLRLNVTRSFEALAAIYLCCYFRDWETEIIYRSLAHKCYANNYNGKWKVVQKFLETKFQTPEQFQQIYIAEFGSESFFGNLVYVSFQLEHRMNYKDISKPDNHKVRRPQRYRGYRDKGSRRLSHEYHGDPPISPEREDRRLLVSHPLINDRVEVNLSNLGN